MLRWSVGLLRLIEVLVFSLTGFLKLQPAESGQTVKALLAGHKWLEILVVFITPVAQYITLTLFPFSHHTIHNFPEYVILKEEPLIPNTWQNTGIFLQIHLLQKSPVST